MVCLLYKCPQNRFKPATTAQLITTSKDTYEECVIVTPCQTPCTNGIIPGQNGEKDTRCLYHNCPKNKFAPGNGYIKTAQPSPKLPAAAFPKP